MERIYRILFLGFFILGFIGVIASADLASPNSGLDKTMIAFLKDIQSAQEANDINSGQWLNNFASLSDDGSTEATDIVIASQD